MMDWRKLALIGFSSGVAVAAILYAAVWISAGQHAETWSSLVRISMVLFPSHVFFLPLQGNEGAGTIAFYFLLAFSANGVLYALVLEFALGVYTLSRRLLF